MKTSKLHLKIPWCSKKKVSSSKGLTIKKKKQVQMCFLNY